MLQGILIIVVFLFFALLLFKQKIPSFLALLSMAILMLAIAGAPLMGDKSILQVLNDGSFRLASSMIALLFGAWVGEIMNETGITRDIIRRASELAGDRPMVVAIVMYIVVALLFTTLTGLGSHIMVAMLVLPILGAVGIKPLAASCLLIMARTTGLIFNMSQWTLYVSALKLDVNSIKNFAIVGSSSALVMGMVYIVYQLKFKKSTAFAIPVAIDSRLDTEKKVPILSLLTPLIPFPLVIGLKWEIIPALLAAAVYGAVVSSPKKIFPVLSKTAHEAVKLIAPSLILMVTIGILLTAVGNTLVSQKLLTVIGPIVPSTAIAYILFFAIGAPFVLYRGPLNIWGMGAGVIGLLASTGNLPVMAVCAGFIALQVIQLSSDPTNTHNVWTADYYNLEVNTLTKSMLVFMWIGAIGALVVASFMYF